MNRYAMLFAAVMVLMMTGRANSQVDNEAMRALAPSGTLRVAIAVGPAASALWATRDANGKPQGVTVTLGTALAAKLGVPVAFVEYKSSGEIIEAAGSGAWDVGFTPVDDDRKQKVDFGPNYALGESTYMVAPGSAIQTIAEVDRAGVRVVGVENTATIRTARRTLKNTQAIGTKGLDEAVDLIRSGGADAIALGRESLESLVEKIPGARVLDGYFHATGTAVAVPKGREASLSYVSDFIETAKADGTVRRALDSAGLQKAKVAPAGSRS
jgi:polar amino acid transport system substrate-binding protein